MNVKIINHEYDLGPYFQKFENKEWESKNIFTYDYDILESGAFLQIQKINKECEMSDDFQELVKEVYGYCEENVAVIEIKQGLTKDNNKYAYSITKVKENEQLIMYYLDLQIKYEEETISIFGVFHENGTTGVRDTIIYGKSIKEINEQNPWAKDPYNIKKEGFLMNQSEKEEYDVLFPKHPLTMARLFLKNIVK